jgi:hemoglobin
VRLRVGARPPACARNGLTARQALQRLRCSAWPTARSAVETGEIMGAHSIGSEEGAVVAVETQSWYERLGGVYAIAVVVDDFIDRIMVDPRLNAHPRVDEAHHRVSAQGFKYYVTEQVCWTAGGPQTYSGRTMLDAHREQLISGVEWDAFIDDFHQTLAKFGVPERERGELDAIVESTKDHIVTTSAAPAASQ